MKIPEYANIITDPDLYDSEPKLDRTILYKADKLELYNHMINFINNARKKKRPEAYLKGRKILIFISPRILIYKHFLNTALQ